MATAARAAPIVKQKIAVLGGSTGAFLAALAITDAIGWSDRDAVTIHHNFAGLIDQS